MATAAHDRIDRMILLDWPDEVDAPSFTHLHPAGRHEGELLYIKELTVIADAERSAEAVLEAIDQLSKAATAFRPGLPEEIETVVFASQEQLGAAVALGRARPEALPRWLGEQLHREQADYATPAQSLLAWPALAISVLSRLHEWRSLDAVVAPMTQGEHRLIWDRLVRELDLVVTPDHAASRSVPTDLRRGTPSFIPPEPPATAPTQVTVSRRSSSVRLTVDLALPEIANAITAVVAHIAEPPVSIGQDTQDPATHVNSSPPQLSQLAEADKPLQVAHPQGSDHIAARPERFEPEAGDDTTRVARSSDDGEAVGRAYESDEPTTWRPPALATGLGGVLYLVNPLSRLDLAEFDLDAPDPWHLLAGVARELVDLNQERVADPLWQCFAEWSGAEPPDRLAHQGAYEALAAHIRSELNFRHPEPTLSDVLCLPAQLVTVDRSIRVYFPIDAAELAVRKRGLDIDPGWIPGFTHSIRFFFGEQP